MTTLSRQTVQERLERVTSLPSIPQVIMRIKEITEDPKASVADLANSILSDHQLTSRILRMANSAFYGEFSGKITTVTHAIMLMGFRAVRNIAISMVVYDAVNKISRGSGFDVKEFWSRSLASGVVAKYLAKATGQKKLLEVAFIAGFMHDIGQVVLAGIFSDEYREMSTLDRDPAEIQKTERILLGIDHLEAGAFVARQWNLPELLVKPIAEHTRAHKGTSISQASILTNMVYLGEMVYPYVTGRESIETPAYREIVQIAGALIGVSDDDMLNLPALCREQVAEIAQELDIDLGDALRREAAPEIELAEVHQQLTNKEVQLAFLQSAAENLMHATNEEETHLIICEAICHGLQMGRVILFERTDDGTAFRGRVGFGIESQEEAKGLSFPADSGLFAHLTATGQPLSVVDRNADLYKIVAATAGWEKLETVAFALVPIKLLDDVAFAILVEMADRSIPLDDERLRSVAALANQGSMALERQMLRARLAAERK